MSIPYEKRKINYPDIADIERQAQYDKRRIRLKELINVPVTVLGATFGPSKFDKLDENGKPILDEHGKPVKGECAIVHCLLNGEGEVRTYSTSSAPIIRQLKTVQEHFMLHKVPKIYQGFKAILKQDGRCLRLFTSKNAMNNPVIEHSDAVQTLQEAGSPITEEDLKYGSTIDEDTKNYLEHEGNEMTQLVGDPADPYNDTTLPLKQRKQLRHHKGGKI